MRLEREALTCVDFVDVPQRAAVQLIYLHSGSGGQVSEVEIVEAQTTVTVTLFERVLCGTFPDGTIAAQTADACASAIEIALARPLGPRQLIDGSRGEGPREGLDDVSLSAIARGCPRWVS